MWTKKKGKPSTITTSLREKQNETIRGKENETEGEKIPYIRVRKVQYFMPAFYVQNVISSQFELTTFDHETLKYFPSSIFFLQKSSQLFNSK